MQDGILSCDICSKTSELTKHHKKRESFGGTNDDFNIVIICRQCHDLVENIYDRIIYIDEITNLIRAVAQIESGIETKFNKAKKRIFTSIEKNTGLNKSYLFSNFEALPDIVIDFKKNIKKIIEDRVDFFGGWDSLYITAKEEIFRELYGN